MFYLVINNAIVKIESDKVFFDDVNDRYFDFRNGITTDGELAGWQTLDDSASRPADTATVTHTRTVQVVAGQASVVWVERNKSAEELESDRLSQNEQVVQDAISAAIARLDVLISAPPLPTPPAGTMNNATLSTTLRSLADYVQQNRNGAQDVALILKQTIKLVRGDYDTVD